MNISAKLWGAITFFIIAVFVSGIFIGITFYQKNDQKENKDLKKEFKPATLNEGRSRIIESLFVAIDNNGGGVIGYLTTELRQGTGLVLVNINDILADFNTQYSARLAAKVAENYTGMDLSGIDIIFNLQADASIIGGQSAGSTMTAAVIAGLMNRSIVKDVIITGSIKENGEIGDAGAIKEKATAAKRSNAKLFLVAPGFSSEASHFTKEKFCSNLGEYEYCKIEYKEGKVNIGDEVGIKMMEVKNIGEALDYLLE